MELNSKQLGWVSAPLDCGAFLEGPAGSGKTTAAAARLIHMLCQGIRGEQVLVLVPQRTLGMPYQRALQTSPLPPGGRPQVLTLGGLAQRMVALFWPLVAGEAGFSHPNRPPVFLTLETAQYTLDNLLRPLLAEGFFDGLRIDHHRLLSQILDNLNKAAVTGLELSEVNDRLLAAWSGNPSQRLYYSQAIQCARMFRAHCLNNNLLDYSLQVEIFTRCLWPNDICRRHLSGSTRHLIADNLEEDVPAAHRIVLEWLPALDSAFLISDEEGGFRVFLGANPRGVEKIKAACQLQYTAVESLVIQPELESTRSLLTARIGRRNHPRVKEADNSLLRVRRSPNYPAMVAQAAEDVVTLIRSGEARAGEIAILSPFLSDTLHFSLRQALDHAAVPHHSLRPSRSLKADPLVRCLITWAKLAHPHWGMAPPAQDVREALHLTISDLDLVRAELLARHVNAKEGFRSTNNMPPNLVGRIGAGCVNLYEDKILHWIGSYLEGSPADLDVFFSRLFSELLAHPRFRFHHPGPEVNAVAMLIESARKFRIGMAEAGMDSQQIARAYVEMVESGVLSAQYLHSWQDDEVDAVRISPATTFIMTNRPARYQLWLDTGSLGWWQRLHQPLTQPYVLSPHWPSGRPWTDADECAVNQANLERLVTGLLRRCSGRVQLYAVGQNESGNEERGPLLTAVQGLLLSFSRQNGSASG